MAELFLKVVFEVVLVFQVVDGEAFDGFSGEVKVSAWPVFLFVE